MACQGPQAPSCFHAPHLQGAVVGATYDLLFIRLKNFENCSRILIKIADQAREDLTVSNMIKEVYETLESGRKITYKFSEDPPKTK